MSIAVAGQEFNEEKQAQRKRATRAMTDSEDLEFINEQANQTFVELS